MLICKLPSFVRISYEVQRIDHSADMVLYRITAGGFIRVDRLVFLGVLSNFCQVSVTSRWNLLRGGIAADGWIVDGCLFTNYRYAFALLTKRNVLFIPPLGKGLH